MSDRRQFIRQIGAAGGVGLFSTWWNEGVLGLPGWESEFSAASLENLDPDNEADWRWIRQQFSVSSTVINFNNAGVSPQPNRVREMFEALNLQCNSIPPIDIWRRVNLGRERVRNQLANLLSCDPEEVAINRNTTESMAMIINGVNWKKGDEVVLSPYDYPKVVALFKQQEKRHGIVLKFVDHQLPIASEDEIAESYIRLFTSKTRMVNITHMLSFNGQVIPPGKIGKKAREMGINVLIDGAHSVAHFDFKIEDLYCDYFGSSLHKWVYGPFGTGMLYVRKEKIADIWPLHAAESAASNDIRKFEDLGTRSIPAEMAVGYALEFQESISLKAKETRLRYLTDAIWNGIKSLPGVVRLTPEDANYYAGIIAIGLDGYDLLKVRNWLWVQKQILCTVPAHDFFHCLRISPNIFNTMDDVEVFIRELKNALDNPKLKL